MIRFFSITRFKIELYAMFSNALTAMYFAILKGL